MFSENIEPNIKNKTALVIGCGGLGCYVVEYLSRLNIGKIIIADNDVFSESNLNRQLYSSFETLGKSKVEIAKERVKKINPETFIEIHNIYVNKENIEFIAKDCDIVFDCCDNTNTKLMLENFCEKKELVLIHGAIDNVYGQVATVYPGNRTLSKIYSKEVTPAKTFSYVPPLIASFQVSEGIKVLTNTGKTLNNKIITIDLRNNEIEILG